MIYSINLFKGVINMDNCVFQDKCSKFKTEACNPICYAYVFMHGMDGTGGMWATRNVPKKYENLRVDYLPEGKHFDRIRVYISKLPQVVEEGKGLFLYSIPSPENKFGTGNGKTTSACIILNEFLVIQSMRHIKREINLETNPTLFVKASDFQNLYNSQFRGTPEMQEEASSKYYKFKSLMKEVQLLVLDDIAIRSGTEAFLNELYEVIDERNTEELTTIFTSNIPLDKLIDFFGERIVSRIEGMTVPIGFTGKDYRKKTF